MILVVGKIQTLSYHLNVSIFFKIAENMQNDIFEKLFNVNDNKRNGWKMHMKTWNSSLLILTIGFEMHLKNVHLDGM